MKGALFELFFPSSYTPHPLTPPPKIKNKLEDLDAEALNLCKKSVEKCVGRETLKYGLKQLHPEQGLRGSQKIQRCANRDLGTRQEVFECAKEDSCSQTARQEEG